MTPSRKLLDLGEALGSPWDPLYTSERVTGYSVDLVRLVADHVECPRDVLVELFWRYGAYTVALAAAELLDDRSPRGSEALLAWASAYWISTRLSAEVLAADIRRIHAAVLPARRWR